MTAGVWHEKRTKPLKTNDLLHPDCGLWTADCGLNFVQKKVKKNVDARLAFWQIGLTHGNNRTTTQNKMRTKTLLLSAAALLAAGFVSSQAQPVYSQNIVGYASVALTGGQYNMMAVPFDLGVSN